MPARRALFFLVLALAVTRLWHVAALADVFFYGEELEKGAAAKAMLDGLSVPRHQLAYHYYEGGGFLISHLNALAFLVCGESLLALKLVSLCWSTAVLALGYRFCQRHLSAGAAVVFGLLFVFAPEAFQKLGLLDLGIHFEALLFVTIVLDRTFRIVFGDEPRRLDFAMLGLATGFGTWFSYQVAPVAAFALLLILVRRPRAFLSAGTPIGAAATAVGALPLVWMWSQVGGALFDIHGGALFGASERPWFERVGATLGAFVGSTFEVGLRFLWGPVLVPFALALALILGCVRGRSWLERTRGPWLALVAFGVFDLGIYLASDFAVGEVRHWFQLNRISLLWWTALVVIAPLLAAAWSRAAWIGRPVVVALVGCGVAATIAIGLDGRPARPLENLVLVARTKGYVYPQYLAKIWSHLDGDDEVKLGLLSRFDEPEAAGASELRVALGMMFHDPARPFAELVDLFRAVDPEHVDDYVTGLGPWLAFRYGLDPRARLARLADYPPAFHGALVEAIARFGRALQVSREHLLAEAQIAWPTEHAERAARGFGERLADWARLDPDRVEELLGVVDAAARARLRRGFEAALAARSLRDR